MNNTHLKIPPDVSGLPIVGRAFDFLRANGIPLDVLRRLHEEHGDVVRFNVMNRPFHLVVNPELTHEILVKRISEFPKPSAVTDQSMGITRFLGMGILTAGYDEWKPQRKLMQPFMHRTHIESYADTMGALGEKLLDTWQDDSERNIHSDMHKVTMWIIAKTVFDLDVDELQDFEAIVKEIQQIILDDMISFLPAKLSGRDAKAARLNDTLTAFVDEMIAKRKVDTVRAGDDLLSLLLATTDEAGQALSDTFIRDNILTMFFAGHETTANTLTWAFYYLSQNPDVLATLQAEVDTVLADGRTPTLADLPDLPYTLMVIKETMRIQPTIPVIPRALPKTTMLGDYHIETPSLILMSPHLLHHDERYWSEPALFDPTRFSAENEPHITKYAYLPFGGGPRVCIGNHFALMEAQILLAQMVRHYELRLVDGTSIKPQFQLTTFPKNGLPMRVSQRQAVRQEAIEHA